MINSRSDLSQANALARAWVEVKQGKGALFIGLPWVVVDFLFEPDPLIPYLRFTAKEK